MTMRRVASAHFAREILRVTGRLLRQCRKPHGSRVFFIPDLLVKAPRDARAMRFLQRDVGARAPARMIRRTRNFFSQDAVKHARECEFEIETARISAR